LKVGVGATFVGMSDGTGNVRWYRDDALVDERFEKRAVSDPLKDTFEAFDLERT